MARSSSLMSIVIALAFLGLSSFNVVDARSVETVERQPLDEDWICSVCNHVYTAAKDGNGQPFASLPSSWVCPVCGAPKSAYKQTTSDGSVQWVHDEAETKVVEDVIGDVDVAVEVTTADGVWTCSVCNHIYDATKDGNGQTFESLPSSWVCPVCGAPKSAYKQKAGSNEWVH